MAWRVASSRSVAEAVHDGDGLDVAGGDAAAVGADDAAQERGVLVVLHDPVAPFRCQRLLDAGRALGRAGGISHGCRPRGVSAGSLERR